MPGTTRRRDSTPGRRVHVAVFRDWLTQAKDRLDAGVARDLLLLELSNDQTAAARLDAAGDRLSEALRTLWPPEE